MIEKKTIKLPHPDYQPTKAKLEEDISLNVTLEQMTSALRRPVNVEYEKLEETRAKRQK